MMRKKILLTGASGTIGKATFTELILHKKEYDISIFIRPSRKNKKLFELFQDEVNIYWDTLQDYAIVEKAITEQDIIIHLAATIQDLAMEDPDFAISTNVDGTKNILNAMLKQKIHPKIIYTSSIAVYGDRIKNPVIKLSDPIDLESEDVYTQTKIKAEKLIRESGLEYTIFRVSYVIATDMLKFRPIMFHMPLDTSVEPIHAKDVGLALVNAIKSNKIWGKTFNLGGGEKCQILFRDNLNDILEIMGFGRNFFPEEAFAKNNFHCGFFDKNESQEIQQILEFQRYTLHDIYKEVKEWIGIKKYLIPLVKPLIRWYLLKRSIFYKENKKQNNQKK